MELINTKFDIFFAGCCDPTECTCEDCGIEYEKEFNKNFLETVAMINRCNEFQWIEYIECSKQVKEYQRIGFWKLLEIMGIIYKIK